MHESLLGKVSKLKATMWENRVSTHYAKGKDVPMLIKRVILKAKANNPNKANQHINECARRSRDPIGLNSGTKLAARFPHLVKAAAPT